MTLMLAVLLLAQEPQPVNAHTVQRLEAVGRLWGEIKFFHPYLAYKKIDWDGALVKALPAIQSARTPDEYRAAVASLLAPLEDPLTSVVEDTTPAAATRGAKPFRTKDGYVIVDAASSAATFMSLDLAAMAKLREQTLQEFARAKGMALDLRGVPAGQEFILRYFLDQLLPGLVAGTHPLATRRYRTHSGYVPQTGTTSGDYHSGFMSEAPRELHGRAAGAKPLAVVLDRDSEEMLDVVGALQSAGAQVVQVGDRAKLGGDTHRIRLADGLQARVRLSELLLPDGGTELPVRARVQDPEKAIETAIAVLSGSAGDQPASPRPVPAPLVMRTLEDDPYTAMVFPDAAHRLLALFRFWSVIRYFFPYRHLTDKPWDSVLADFIPRMLACESRLDYEKTVAEMVARLQDTHGSIAGSSALEDDLGRSAPPLALRVAAGERLAVERVREPERAAGLAAGDVILAVDGVSIAERVESLARYRALSTRQASYRYVYPTALRGAKDTKARLRVVSPGGAEREVEIARTMPLGQASALLPRSTPVHAVLPSGYGYVDLARLPGGEAAHRALDAVMKTPAVIFDMRGYPNGTAWTLGPRLSEKSGFTTALFRRPDKSALQMEGADVTFEQKMPRRFGATYGGKVVMLINEDAISQAEHTCLFFEAAAGVTFVGSATNGANGDVTNFFLPGGIQVRFSGQEVRHADGRQLQRVGVQPHVKTEPTPEGLRDGRDEVLEAAVRYLDGQLKAR